jgi:hypothetical protein
MPLYELRTYTLHVGKMAEAVKLYQEIGFPALRKGGQDKKLVGYFQSDTGTINQTGSCQRFRWTEVSRGTDGSNPTSSSGAGRAKASIALSGMRSRERSVAKCPGPLPEALTAPASPHSPP